MSYIYIYTYIYIHMCICISGRQEDARRDHGLEDRRQHPVPLLAPAA